MTLIPRSWLRTASLALLLSPLAQAGDSAPRLREADDKLLLLYSSLARFKEKSLPAYLARPDKTAFCYGELAPLANLTSDTHSALLSAAEENVGLRIPSWAGVDAREKAPTNLRFGAAADVFEIYCQDDGRWIETEDLGEAAEKLKVQVESWRALLARVRAARSPAE